MVDGQPSSKLAIKARQESAARPPALSRRLQCEFVKYCLHWAEDRAGQALNDFATKLSNIAPGR